MLRHALSLGCLIVLLSTALWAQTSSKESKDYSAEMKRIPPREPADALKSFQMQAGFHLEIVAAEPLVQSPIAAEFDENGRMFVIELPEYNQYGSTKSHGKGRVTGSAVARPAVKGR